MPLYRVLWLIPVLVLGYVAWQNLTPLGATTWYLIDVGGEDSAGRAVITGPFDRLSRPKESEGTSYRELEKNLVYFTLDDPGLSSASRVTVRVRFQDNFPRNAPFIIGARNTLDWGYSWKEGYVPFFRDLAGLTPLVSDERGILYGTGPGPSYDFQDLNDFLENPPLGSVIAANVINLSVNQSVPQALPDIDLLPLDDRPFVPSGPGASGATLRADTSLRGAHTLWTYVHGGTLELRVTKQDLNWYGGADELLVEVYSSSRELKGRMAIRDDGHAGPAGQLGPLQDGALTLTALEPGAYRVELKGNSDILVRGIAVNQEKLVIEGNVFLAGMNAAYFKDPAGKPATLYTREYVSRQVKLRTSHNSGLQEVLIRGTGFNAGLNINKVDTDFAATLPAGSFQLTLPVQDVSIEHQGFFSFTPDSFFLPQRARLIEMQYDTAWLRANADFVFFGSAGYGPPEEDAGWLMAQASWQLEDLYVTDNKLVFGLSAPHLARPADAHKTIPVDRIEITLETPPLHKR
ncbi:MAG: hypothetical protein HYX96_02625 [Chloroflexi bacterium]|nr:hypothetical protein [Chloroflexota bacterium]